MFAFWWQPFIHDILRWYLAVALIGWLAYPFIFRALMLSPGRGLGLSKLIGLVLWTFALAWISYLDFLPARLGPNRAAYAALAVVAGLSAVAWIRTARPLWEFLRSNLRAALAFEFAFAGAFLAFLWFRSYIPDATFDVAWAGAEKWGNLAILTSLWRDAAIPPADPWLAGYALNYYYFSHLIWASLARLVAVAPPLAFNLGLGTLFALLLSAAYSVGRALSERRSGGWWAVFLVALAGTPATWSQAPFLLETLREHGVLTALRSFDFWSPSDVIPNTRNEFPAFNWLLGDLHAHGAGFLLLLAAIAVLGQIQRVREVESSSWRALLFLQSPAWFLLVILMAAMWAANGWDLIVLALLGLGWILVESFRSARHGAEALGQALQGTLVWALAGLLAVGLLATFYAHHTQMPLVVRDPDLARLPAPLSVLGSLGWVPIEERVLTEERVLIQKRTFPSQWFAFWGLLACIPTFVLCRHALRRILSSRFHLGSIGLNSPFFAALAALAVGGVLAWLHRADPAWTAPGLLALAAVGAYLLVVRPSRPTPAIQWALLLGTTALLLQIVPEFLFVDDPIGPPYQRYNTVFKLYYAGWGLAALCGAILLSGASPPSPSLSSSLHDPLPDPVEPALPPKPTPPRQIVQVAARAPAFLIGSVVLLAGSAYPLMGVAHRVAVGHERVARSIDAGLSPQQALAACRTLDSLAFLALPQYAPDDRRLGLWMRDSLFGPPGVKTPNAPAPKIVELAGDSYSMVGRFAVMTGVPSIMGWVGHQSQWRGAAFSGANGPWAERHDALERLYATLDDAEALDICRRHGFRWIVVGSLEREKYASAPGALEKFNRVARRVKSFGQSALYEISPAQLP